MPTSKPICSIVSLADFRVAVAILREGTGKNGAAVRCAHALLDSLTAIAIATEAKRRWLQNGAVDREAVQMHVLISVEHERAKEAAVRLRSLTSPA